MDLSHKQIKFCEEYLKDFNGTRAAIKAGYSKKTASEQASRLLSNVKVAKYFNSKFGHAVTNLQITSDRAIKEIAALCYSDARKLYNEDGTLRKITDLDDETAASIAGVEVDEKWEWDADGKKRIKTGMTKKVKRYDKTKALELMGRYLKLFGSEPATVTNQIYVHIGT